MHMRVVWLWCLSRVKVEERVEGRKAGLAEQGQVKGRSRAGRNGSGWRTIEWVFRSGGRGGGEASEHKQRWNLMALTPRDRGTCHFLVVVWLVS